MSGFRAILRSFLTRVVRFLHGVDFRLLPFLARLPLSFGYFCASLRSWLIGITGWDWRSVALGSRHVVRQSTLAYQTLFPEASKSMIRALVRERFEAESREEFEGRLIAAGRLSQLRYTIQPEGFLQSCLNRDRGLILLTSHLDSLCLGIALLGHAGLTINAMSSAIISDPRLCLPLRRHYFEKYRGMERYMNGGCCLDMEAGMRPFYEMLSRRECLVICADVPAVEGSASAKPIFLGCRRSMVGGALRLARKTGSDLGVFVCRFQRPGYYIIQGGEIKDVADSAALDSLYDFLSQAIMASPGRWWASYLLPVMVPVEVEKTTGEEDGGLS